MSRATLTEEIEQQIVERLAREPDIHVKLPASAYRADGSLLVYRDNLPGVRAQRHLWRRMVGELEVGDYLRRQCDEQLCINPHHYDLQRRSRQGLTHCPNGHRYTKANTIPDGKLRCRTCKEAADARRLAKHPLSGQPNPASLNAAKTQCIRGHAFTPENTYTYGTRRSCRTCAIERARNRRAPEQLPERKAS